MRFAKNEDEHVHNNQDFDVAELEEQWASNDVREN